MRENTYYRVCYNSPAHTLLYDTVAVVKRSVAKHTLLIAPVFNPQQPPQSYAKR